jgi:hypothetical protein
MYYIHSSDGENPGLGICSQNLDKWDTIPHSSGLVKGGIKKNRVKNDPELPNLTAYEDYNNL